jgi:hypothetical protein
MQPRTFVPRALLYNDGGFDVSPDGSVLCACAEYWLPDGVENVMELLQQQEASDDDDSDDEGIDETATTTTNGETTTTTTTTGGNGNSTEPQET